MVEAWRGRGRRAGLSGRGKGVLNRDDSLERDERNCWNKRVVGKQRLEMGLGGR